MLDQMPSPSGVNTRTIEDDQRLRSLRGRRQRHARQARQARQNIATLDRRRAALPDRHAFRGPRAAPQRIVGSSLTKFARIRVWSVAKVVAAQKYVNLLFIKGYSRIALKMMLFHIDRLHIFGMSVFGAMEWSSDSAWL